MLNNTLKYLTYGNRYCGIEHYSNNGKDILQVNLLKQSKNELDVESVFCAESIEEATKQLFKNQHTILVINNDKVLSKTIESKQNDVLKIAYKAFPNINLDDFYFEVLFEKNLHFISICRKDYVNTIIDNYAEQNVFIIGISLGNNIVSNVKSFFSSGIIYTSNSIVTIENSHIVSIQKNETEHHTYNINGLTIPNDQILSFSAALQSVLNNSTTKSNFESKKTSLINEFKHARFFGQFLKFGGLFILLLRLVNFFLFNHYFNNVSKLNQVSEINQSIKTQIINLNETVSKKQKMVDDLLKSNGSKSSFYSDRIIQSLPKSVLLSELDYQPLLKRIKAKKLIELNENNIIISGTSNDSKAYTNWISELEQEDWIEKVDIIDYGKAASDNSGFEIKVVLKNE